MKGIEFIGAPAVGKSTLMKEVLGLRKYNDTWLTSKEARIKIAKGLDNKDLLHKIIQLCLHLNIMKRGHNLMASLILKKFEQEVMAQKQMEYNYIAGMFLKQIKESNVGYMQNMQAISFNFDILFREVMTLDYFQVKGLIIYDEGLIHNNLFFRREDITEEFIKKYQQYDSPLIPSGIIYCYIRR